MFSCRSCLRRHIYGFLQDTSLYQTGQKSALLSKQARLVARRYNTAAAVAESDEWETSRSKTPYRQDAHTSPRQSSRYQSGTNREQWLQSRGTRPPNKSRKLPTAYATQKELTWLGDPLKLANHVLSLLREDRFEEAENFVRTASKNIQCIVSWNHLVNWQINRGKVNAAIKTYNEVFHLLPLYLKT
jgi:hypothetical protein